MLGAVDDSADWVAVSQIADRYRVTRQAVSKRVAKFREGGKLQTRGEGRNLRVHLPTYVALVAETHDPAQDLRNRAVKREDQEAPLAASAEPEKRLDPVKFDEAAAREKNAKAALAEMQLAQKRGELVPAREIERAAIEAGTSIAQAVNAIKSSSGKLYAAAKGGEEALHIELLAAVNAALGTIGDAMAKLAARGASETD
ncbi:hypothetical protein [Methylocystis iwaonis]|uniref:hypothetical protein n=1 Tax=Methylocystis iwaonis TaxID=2885079 RepID=UPI002E7ADC9B|nr:hypothetical protein [Methylocystis iwaonis]